MRLHSLSMTAIGPYVGTERIDFDALAADGLFLFTGPTGAGKSTVLDAVTYALYGRLPGNRDGHLSRLKSDFAADDVAPEVVLEVTVAGDRLRIHRSPAFQRPSKRAPHKLTTQRSSVCVERLVDGAWLGVEGARKEQVANEWLHDKIGLNADQFTQVVLLPQGQFAEFLHAEDDVREKLLTSLFDAHRFKEVESWFDERQRAEAALAAESEARVASLRTRAQTIADLADDDCPDTPEAAWFSGLAQQHAALAEQTRVQREIATRLQEDAAARLRDATETAELLGERAAALELRDAVRLQRPIIAELRERVSRAAAAAAVLPLVRARDQRAAAAAAADATVTKLRTTLELMAPDVDGADLRGVRRRVRTLTAERGGLAEVVAAERALPAQLQEVAAAESAARTAARAVEVLRSAQAQLPALRSAADGAVTALRARSAVLQDARTAVSQLRGSLSAAKEAEKLRPRLAQAQDFLREKRDDVLGAREHLNDLRERRIAGMAAEIALELQDGEACKVCGSPTHPNPARRASDAPGADQIDTAQRHLDSCRAVEESASASVADLRQKLAAAEAVAADRGVAELKAALAAAEERLRDATDAADELPAALTELARIDGEIGKADEALAAAQAAHQDRQATHRDLAAQAARTVERVSAARENHESVANGVAAIDGALEVLEAYVAALAAQESAAEELTAAVRAVTDAAREAGFADVEEVGRAALQRKVLQEAQELIAQFERDDASAETRLSNPRIADLPSQSPDTAPLRAALEAAQAAADEARDTDARQQERCRRLAALADQARSEVADALAVAARAGQIRELALLVRGMGANSKKMNLTAYFLAARLEQVTEVASEHLRRMSSGRYTLRHTDERRTARGHGGLGLEVFDAYTGKPRPPHSLSGGETFIASLALALGLAEVVTAETGAMTLDSLFIDEGFGSLDPDTLDQAMAVLDGLRQVGRTIGVISHVEEMRTRITNQLVIQRTDRGSRVLAH